MPLLFAYDIKRFSHDKAQIVSNKIICLQQSWVVGINDLSEK